MFRALKHTYTHTHTHAGARGSAQITNLSERSDGSRGKTLFVPPTRLVLGHFIN